MSSGQKSGNGEAKITAVNVNSAPVQQSKTVSGKALGTGGAETIKSYQLGQDADYANTSGANANSVYYVNSASDLGNWSGAKVYADSGCTIDASAYIGYSFTDNQTLKITEYKKLPRQGTHSQSNNSLKLYVRLRDSFGGSTSTYAHGVYSFTVNYNAVTSAHGSAANGESGGGNYVYRYGASNTSSPSEANVDGKVYSPSAAGTFALTVGQPIQIGTSVTVSAAGLLSVPSSHYQAVIVPDTAGSAYKYEGSGVTFYDWTSGGSYTQRTGYTSLKITGMSPAAVWQKAQWTVYVVEKSAVSGSNYEPAGISYSGGQALEVNFRVDNTRPTVKAGTDNVVDVDVGGTKSITLSEYYSDADESITTSTHMIKGVKVPEYEYVQLDKYGKILETPYYNVSGAMDEATLKTSGTNGEATGFDGGIASTAASGEAFVKYAYSGIELKLTGLRPSYSQYKAGRTGKTAYTGGTYMSPTGSAAVRNAGHFYILINVQDKNDTSDEGIWLPLGITVGGRVTNAPVAVTENAGNMSGQTPQPTRATAAGARDEEYVFTPLGHNVGGSNPVGKYMKGGVLTSAGLQALAVDGDSYGTPSGTAARSGQYNEFVTITGYETGLSKYVQIDEIDIYVEKSKFGGRVAVGGTWPADSGVETVELEDGGNIGGVEYYKTKGLKLTLKTATLNRYYGVGVELSDSTGKPCRSEILVKVTNRGPQALTETDIATGGVSEYGNGDDGIPTLIYRVPMKTKIIITPYDLVRDLDMQSVLGSASMLENGFTLNGMSGATSGGTSVGGVTEGGTLRLSSGNGLYGGAYGSPDYAATVKGMLDGIATTITGGVRVYADDAGQSAYSVANVGSDRLYFMRRGETSGDAYEYVTPSGSAFELSTTGMTNYIKRETGSTVEIDGTEYALDYVMFTTETRTPQTTEAVLTVRDRYCDSTVRVRVRIDVVNTAPIRVTPAEATELAVTPVTTDGGATIVTPTTAPVLANRVMKDLDEDTPTYMQSRGVLIANTPDLKVTDGFDSVERKYLTDDGTDGGRLLSEYYVRAQILSTMEMQVSAIGSTKNIAGGVYVYFYVSDGRGGEALGYKQVEVLNTRPKFNTSDGTGFDAATKTWSVESTSRADIVRARYIASSTRAKDALKTEELPDDGTGVRMQNAVDADVKIIATDADALQGIVPAAKRNGGERVKLNGTDYAGAVPDVSGAEKFDGNGSAAVAVYESASGTAVSGERPGDYSVTLMFYIGDRWYTRATLIAGLEHGTVSAETCFDAHGRFTVTDWAVRLRATQALSTRLGITLSIADEAKYGGDTYGLPTGYANDRTEGGVVVDGAAEMTVYQTISDTGIRTKDEYAAYGNKYVVEDPEHTGKAYVATKTGYADYESGAAVAGEYAYADTVVIPAATQNSEETNVYVPMSYFGLNATITTPDATSGAVSYGNTYVGYDVRSGSADADYDRSDIETFAAALTLSDGTKEWSGAALNSNPYVTIDAVSYSGAAGAAKFGEPNSIAYYNTNLSVPTVDGEGASLGYAGVSADKRVMWLSEQAEKLPEHNFGLSISKNEVRTGPNGLTLTVKLAKSVRVDNGDGGYYDRTNVKASEQAGNEKSNARSVTIRLKVENTAIELVADGTTLKYDETRGTYYTDVKLAAAQTAEYALIRTDADARESAITGGRAVKTVGYTDTDYRGDSGYRDYAYFLSDSLNALSAWREDKDAATERTRDPNNYGKSDRAQRSMLNYYGVADSAGLDGIDKSTYRANGGVYGTAAEGYSGYFSVATSENGRIMNIMTSRKTYVNETALESIAGEFGYGYDAERGEYGGLTQAQLRAIYASRGLELEYAAGSSDADIRIARAYYPLKVLVYDSYGTGYGEGAYAAMEFRIEIVNAAPTLKNIGKYNEENDRREYELSLAVNGNVALNLYDFVNDPDIYIEGSGASRMLSTKNGYLENATGIARETGDYLQSPYITEKITDADANGADVAAMQASLIRGENGFSRQGSDKLDVVMSMETGTSGAGLDRATEPTRNYIWFAVNRRTTDVNGTGINKFEYTLKFYDNHGESTDSITFIITVTNQTPVISTEIREITMRAGESFTVLTTYYDDFIGGVAGGTTAYNNSQTKKNYPYRGETNTVNWDYSTITRAKADEFITDSTAEAPGADKHLGYIGLATDDTAWRLRISDYTKSATVMRCLGVTRQNTLAVEGEGAHGTLPLSLLIRANAACERLAFSMTLIDGEGGSGGTVTYTLYITVVSAPPVARDATDADDKQALEKAGLDGEMSGAEYIAATYKMYGIPSKDTDVTLAAGVKRAYKTLRLELTSVAYDPDGAAETGAMELYGDGMYAVNGVTLARDERSRYVSEYFYIENSADKKSFSITITDYDPNKDYETLTFRIADAGNRVYENTLEITLRIYTLYSDMQTPGVTGLSKSEYETKYLSGDAGNTVRVKSLDEYMGYIDGDAGEATTYAAVKLSGNIGNDGNTDSPVEDPDTHTVGGRVYGTRLYAFMTDAGNAMSAGAIGALMTRDGGALRLKDSGAAERYFIGGVSDGGTDMTTDNKELLSSVFKYAEFAFAIDGTNIRFIPKTSTLGKKILLYAETEKYVGSDRTVVRTDAIMRAGTLFTLEITDSAPRTSGTRRTFVGAKGDSVTYKIHDPSDPYGSLFTDSDAGDAVRIREYENGQASDAVYAKSLERALEQDPTLDWASGDGGKTRAITASVDAEAGTLTIGINRRMDKREGAGYAERVKFVMTFIGRDSMNAPCETEIEITVVNTPVAVKDGLPYEKYDAEGVGYALWKADGGENKYTLDAKVQYGAGLTVELKDFMTDADYTVGGDTDSYRYVGKENNETNYEYVVDGAVTAVHYTDIAFGDKIDLATVTPLGDAWHRTGIRIDPVSATRGYTATVLLRIVDRSTDARDGSAGVELEINITVMNKRPYAKVEVSTETLLGSETGDAEIKTYGIGDYVGDDNESDVVGEASKDSATYLRIYSTSYMALDELYSTVDGAGKPGDDGDESSGMDSSALFSLLVDNSDPYRQTFILQPHAGYYGSGAVEITVADGDMSTDADAKTVTFRIIVKVIYNPSDVDERLNGVETHRGKTTAVTIDTLIPEVESTVDGRARFSPASEYELVSMTPSDTAGSSAVEYVEITHAEGSNVWSVRALKVTAESKRIDVTYRLKQGGDGATYTGYFLITVKENVKPSLIYDEIVFKRYDAGATEADERMLNTNNTVYLRTDQILSDPENDVLKYIAVKSNKPSLVKAELTGDGGLLAVTFNARGTAKLTITVSDETDESCVRTLTVTNRDLAEPSVWMRFMASFESNKVVWAVIIGSVALLLFILVIIIAVVKKRKRAREELEALLVSEMEIEEQMFRLAGGPSPTDCSNYGYLPPTQSSGVVIDPNAMLGAGGETPTPDHAAALPPPDPDAHDFDPDR